MINAVLFYENKACEVSSVTCQADSLEEIDGYFKYFLDEQDGSFIHITYVDSDDCNIFFKTEAL